MHKLTFPFWYFINFSKVTVWFLCTLFDLTVRQDCMSSVTSVQ